MSLLPSSATALTRSSTPAPSRTRASASRSTAGRIMPEMCIVISMAPLRTPPGSPRRGIRQRRLGFFGENDDARRLRPKEYPRDRRLSAHFRHLEPNVVQHPAELVQCIEPNGVLELARAAVVEHHH